MVGIVHIEYRAVQAVVLLHVLKENNFGILRFRFMEINYNVTIITLLLSLIFTANGKSPQSKMSPLS